MLQTEKPKKVDQEILAKCVRCHDIIFVQAVCLGNKIITYEPNSHFETRQGSHNGTVCHCGGRIMFYFPH